MTAHTALVVAHAGAALLALPLGASQLLRRPHGDARHRRAGRVWVLLTLWVAISSFAIRDLRDGRLSLLHVLSAVTIVSVVLGVAAVRRGNVAAHRANLRGAWFGLVGAFVGAVAVPGRMLPTFAADEPLGALGAVAAVALGYAVVVRLADLGAGDRAPAARRARPASGKTPAGL